MLARRVVKPWGAVRGGASPGEPSPNQRRQKWRAVVAYRRDRDFGGIPGRGKRNETGASHSLLETKDSGRGGEHCTDLAATGLY